MTLQKTRENFTGFDGVETCESETPQGYSVSWSETNQRTIDPNGNLIQDDKYSYVWDAENRLIQVNFLNPQATNNPDTVQMTYDGRGKRVGITELHGTTVLTAKTFVWQDWSLAQERDVTGHTVTKQFFSFGEQINGTNYYVVRDHLGSIREMTDSNGTIHANYDYDIFGRQTKLSGDLNADFGYAHYYNYQTTCQYLTVFRVYDPEKGRWLSRDPLAESTGPNLYEYVDNYPIGLNDPFGLAANYDDLDYSLPCSKLIDALARNIENAKAEGTFEQNAALFAAQEAKIAAKCFKDPKDPKGACNVAQEATNRNLNAQRRNLGLPPRCACNNNALGLTFLGLAIYSFISTNGPGIAAACAAF